jgi:hypothetical protein
MRCYHRGAPKKKNMTTEGLDEQRRSDSLGDVIANVAVRGYFHELIEILANLHEDVAVRWSPVDIRAEFAARTICRVVPYRELIHIHVGDAPAWEVRVRDEAGYLEAVDRILDVFLAFVAAGPLADSRRTSRIATYR